MATSLKDQVKSRRAGKNKLIEIYYIVSAEARESEPQIAPISLISLKSVQPMAR